MKVVDVFVISDSSGETAAAMVSASTSQFMESRCIVHRLPMVQSFDQITTFLERNVEGADGVVVFFTIADPEIRRELYEYMKDKTWQGVDLLGPAINAIEYATGLEPSMHSGANRMMDDAYFRRIDAMDFSVDHDDGRNTEDLEEADIVLIGVSRTSKTPLSIYLASLGYKVANIPLALGMEPPSQLFNVEPRKIFGLIVNPDLLSSMRRKRLGETQSSFAPAYVDFDKVEEDLKQAKDLMRKLGCIIIHTDNRAIEETAQEILRYYNLAL
jgi:regulator of PEP synthase PpsR (kinase-PPPase family)